MGALVVPRYPPVGDVFIEDRDVVDPSPQSTPGAHFKEHCTVKTLNAGRMATAQCLAWIASGNAFYVGYGVTTFPNQTLEMYQGTRKVGTMTIAPIPCDGHTACRVWDYVTVTR
jgi:hypothetical protein